jgi:hypothetical protein
MLLPADQRKDGDAKGKQTQDGTWYANPKHGHTIEEEEQNQTPCCDRVIQSHFSLL